MAMTKQEYLAKHDISFCGIDKDKEFLNSQKIDVAVDFSTSDALFDNLQFAKQHNIH